MTKAESLRVLADCAERVRIAPGYAWKPGSPLAASKIHGANAVRAIRSRRIDETNSIRAIVDPYIVVEARLAFRAALDAVGLKSL